MQTFVGLDNYIKIFTSDPYFLKSIGNTLMMMVVFIPCLLVGGLVLASVFNSKLVKGRQYFRLAAFSPYLTLPVAIGVIFAILFDWNSGTINKILVGIGLMKQGLNWLGDPWLARLVICIMIVWKYMGYHMIFFNAGIVSINDELYEAAEVDGATGLQKFRFITLPLLRPIIEFLLIMNCIWGLQLFDEPMVLFSSWGSSGSFTAVGGPDRSCLTAIWNLYNTSFGTQMQYGKGAAIAYGLFLFILVFSLMGFLFFHRRGEENRLDA